MIILFLILKLVFTLFMIFNIIASVSYVHNYITEAKKGLGEDSYTYKITRFGAVFSFSMGVCVQLAIQWFMWM